MVFTKKNRTLEIAASAASVGNLPSDWDVGKLHSREISIFVWIEIFFEREKKDEQL